MAEVDQLHRRVFRRLGQLDLTLEQLAARLGVGKSWVSQLLRRSKLSEQHFTRLSLALGMGAEDWMRPFKDVRGSTARAYRVIRRRGKENAQRLLKGVAQKKPKV